MISVLAYDKQVEEGNLIKTTIKDIAAKISDESWNIQHIKNGKEFEEFIKEIQEIDLACYEVDNQLSIKNLEDLRKRYMDMMVMIIADNTLSPMDYIKPSILASSLILRPVTEKQIYIKMKEFIEQFIDKKDCNNENKYIIDTRDGKTYLSYNKIMYFYAKEKKVYVRLENEEIGFYETIDNLIKNLPENIFVRCHRSFIVNKTKIQKIQNSKNMIIIDNNIMVPISRSYKAKINELIR